MNAPVEGGPASDGDRHVLTLDNGTCKLYEMFNAFPDNINTKWDAACGAVFDLSVNGPLRTDDFTSADAAGLPIFPGLERYEEVIAGPVTHAVRFTAPSTQNTHIWPARHDAGSANAKLPPMGARLRLKANFDISGFSTNVQRILQGLKTYGMILADNGSGWFISGAPNDNWDNDDLHTLTQVPGSAFEVVDTSVLIVDPDSGQAKSWPPPPIFSDDFNDNDITDWTPTKPQWDDTTQILSGTTTHKTDNFPNAFAAGCSTCIIEADIRIDSPGARGSVLAWYQDKQHYVEFRLMDDKNKVLLRLHDGFFSAKKAAPMVITPGVTYHIRVRFSSSGKIIGEIGGLDPFVVTPQHSPSGNVGFRVKSTNGLPATVSFDNIVVY
ncbi:MAG: hypothetical protein C5B54_11710 [Acidobacteria bacterium]|nr:MAG: hypothetical protein C5B54_11710 [Acidobacteriota bacterium]